MEGKKIRIVIFLLCLWISGIIGGYTLKYYFSMQPTIPELSTNLTDWKKCRDSGWNICGQEWNISNQHEDYLTVKNIVNNCWAMVMKICDEKVDINYMYAQVELEN